MNLRVIMKINRLWLKNLEQYVILLISYNKVHSKFLENIVGGPWDLSFLSFNIKLALYKHLQGIYLQKLLSKKFFGSLSENISLLIFRISLHLNSTASHKNLMVIYSNKKLIKTPKISYKRFKKAN